MGRINLIEIIGEPTLSGGAISLLTLLKGLDKKKYHVTCICPPGYLAGVLKELKGIDTAVIAMHSKWDFAASTKIRLFIHKLKKEKLPIIVHCHGTRAGLLGRLAAIGNIENSPKVVYTEHLWTKEYRISNPLSHWVQLFSLWFMDLFTDVTIAVSESVARFLVERKISRPEKIKIIYNGVKINEKRKISDRRYHGEDVTIGFVGSLVKRKGVIYLIKAIYELVYRFKLKDIKLKIVGEGQEKRSLKKLVKKLKLEKNIEFLGLQKEVNSIYSTLDIYVQPSLDEAFGIATLEAMSFGIPPVVSKLGGLRELLNDMSDKKSKKPFDQTDYGILVQPQNPSALAAALKELIQNHKLRLKLAKNALKRTKLFSEEEMVAETEKVYSSLIAK